MSPTWMYRTKESEAARQAAARAARKAKGNCIRCGLACDPRSVQHCTTHLQQQRTYQLDRYYAGKRLPKCASCHKVIRGRDWAETGPPTAKIIFCRSCGERVCNPAAASGPWSDPK